MQEIKKRRIVIASVLKPVDDTRMAEKIGESLASDSDVHVIGFPSASSAPKANLTFHPIADKPFNRLSMKRLYAPFTFLRVAWSIRPDVVIVCTHELLFAAFLLRMLTGCRFLYDVRENYFRNVLFTPAFPLVLRPLIAGYVRLKEWIISPFVNHFLLAEASYQKELPFLGNRFTVIENKFKAPPNVVDARRIRKDRGLKLLFSGTLAESTGVFDAIALAESLHALDRSVALTIAGYAARGSDYERIVREINDKPFIKLVGGNRLIPHSDIVNEIMAADFGIIAYQPNLSTDGSVPTKLFEYLGMTLPILIVDHPEWTKLCAPYSAAIVLNDTTRHPAILLAEMKSRSFYQSPPLNVTWESEEKKLLALF